MDNPEKLATYGTHDEEKQNKNTTFSFCDALGTKIICCCDVTYRYLIVLAQTIYGFVNVGSKTRMFIFTREHLISIHAA